MKEVLKRNLELGTAKLPFNPGVVAFFSKDQMLMCEMTGNISNYMDLFVSEESHNNEYSKLFRLTDRIGYRETDKIFGALLGSKALIQKYQPVFNQKINSHESYVYLGINFKQVPFIKVESTTINNYFYMGPFRSRFFLHDIIDIMLEEFESPACPGPDFPCKLLALKKCPGYCINNKSNLSDNLLNNYLLPQEDRLNILLEKKEKQLTDLQFNKAQTTKLHWSNLKKFYARISFLMVTKDISHKFEYKGKRIKIKNGLLEQVGNRKFNNVIRKYQSNELYAVDKSELNERWVIYNELKALIPRELMAGYNKSRKELMKYMEEKGKENVGENN